MGQFAMFGGTLAEIILHCKARRNFPLCNMVGNAGDNETWKAGHKDGLAAFGGYSNCHRNSVTRNSCKSFYLRDDKFSTYSFNILLLKRRAKDNVFTSWSQFLTYLVVTD